ncbi:MAG: transposase [Clostridia bacterium]|nr:transposase [Clostridia bacterium]
MGRTAKPAEALTRGGRYHTLDNGLEFREIIVGGDSEARRRFVVVLNPAEAERDRKKRDDIVAEATRRLDVLKQLEGEPHEKAACALRSHAVFGRYIHQTKTGRLRIDREKIKAEERLDGKLLVSTSDEGLSVRDVVLGYKQLAAVERVFRDLKHVADLRPIRHRLPERIRAHVLLCWLAMLLIRVAENESGRTWFQIKKVLDTLQVGIHRTRAGEVWQANNPSDDLKELFERLKLKVPPRILCLPIPITTALPRCATACGTRAGARQGSGWPMIDWATRKATSPSRRRLAAPAWRYPSTTGSPRTRWTMSRRCSKGRWGSG